jgi:hypothetical protein
MSGARADRRAPFGRTDSYARPRGWRVRVGWLMAMLAAAVGASVAPAAAEPEPIMTTDVTFIGGEGVILHGIVVAPRPSGKRRPALVMLEGAGNRGRQELRPAADVLARHGVITLIYDKRKVGYSLLQRDYGLLAADTVAAVALLATQRDVDPSRLGLWAQSEGAYVAPLACNRSSAIKFVITVGAIGVTPAVQTSWGYDQFLRHAGVGAGLPHTLEITALRTIISAGLFPEANFDPVPAWEQLRQPVLAEWGELDRVALPRESSTAIEEALSRGGNTRYTMRFISGVRHNLNLTADGGFDRITSLPADYGTYERQWIDDLARTEPSRLGTAGSAERCSGLRPTRHDLGLDDGVRVLPPRQPGEPHSQAPPGLGVGRHPAPACWRRLVHYARSPGLSAVLDGHGCKCHRARGCGPSAPVAIAPGVNGHCRRMHSRYRRQVVAFPSPWRTN